MKTSIIASAAALLCAVAGAAVGTPVLEARAATSSAATTSVLVAVERPSERPVPLDPRVQGCFASAGNLVFIQTVEFNARDSCPKAICMDQLGKNVGGSIRGNECWCGDSYPPKSSLVDDSKCDIGCTGYGQEACGGEFVYTIYNTGKTPFGIEYLPDEAANATQSAAPKTTQSSTGPTSAAASAPSTGGTNTAGIAAGAVVGVVALAAIAGGGWFFYRKRRNQALEEEHRRNAAVNAFIHGNKPPSSSGGVSLTDSRMDPQMAQRRMSDGSIADNQDYSRRILRVTNA